MKRFHTMSSAIVLVAGLAPCAFAAVNADQSIQAEKLLKAYQDVTANQTDMPFLDAFSECAAQAASSECAFNYSTEYEDFGINALYVHGLPEGESSLISFQVDPNGTSLGQASWTIEAPFGKDHLPKKAVRAIGKRIKNAFGPLIGSFGRLQLDESECIVSSDSVWCAFNYETDYENLGIYVKGLLNSDRKSIGFIEVLSVDPNGVYLLDPRS